MGEIAAKIVVVTGGSKRIGESIVRRFWKAGARCVIVSRHPDEYQVLADELKAAGMTVNVLACDVRKVVQIKNLVADTVKQSCRRRVVPGFIKSQLYYWCRFMHRWWMDCQLMLVSIL